MNMVFVVRFELADIISVLNGLLVFTSVILAGSDDWRRRLWAWWLGLTVQLALVLYGWLTVHYGFFTSLIPACAFGWNLFRSYYPPRRTNQARQWSEEASRHMHNSLNDWPEEDHDEEVIKRGHNA